MAAGCAEPTAPLQTRDVVGTYALATIGGQPLPVPPPGVYGLLSAEVTFMADGTWRAREEFGTAGPSNIVPLRVENVGSWTLDATGGTLTQRGGVGVVEYRVHGRGRELVRTGGSGGEMRYVKAP